MSVRDATGRVTNRQLGEARPGDPATEQWTFFSADLRQPRSVAGGLIRDAQGTPPFELRGVFVLPAGAIANQRGVVQFGPALATAAAPASGTDPSLASSGLTNSPEAWRNAVVVQDFTRPGFEAIQGTRPVTLPDVVRVTAEGPPGFASAVRYEWSDAGISPPLRGLRPVADTAIALVYLGADTARMLAVKAGDAVMLSVGGRSVAATVAGVLDYFPTYRPGGSTGLVVMDGSRLSAGVNNAVPDQPLGPNEVWLATRDSEATREGLAPLSPLTLDTRDAVRAVQQDDPLIAAGWAGILAIAFGAVLLLSAIGFIVYSYLTAQQRALEFAILRTLGFSKPQIFSVVLFEHLFVIVAGMGMGTGVGLRVGRLMLAFLGVDETGGQVVPPFVQRVSWTEVFVVWGILGTVFVATIAAVVALYFRLAVSRALRIGDV
ncbi:MAG: ABC transporter permease [Chloroflexi bacterium]|nr:ABC transporter permease [Chloroflexota bacterium]